MTSEKKISGLSKLLDSALGAMKSANCTTCGLAPRKSKTISFGPLLLPVMRPMAEQRLEEYFLALENLVDRFE